MSCILFVYFVPSLCLHRENSKLLSRPAHESTPFPLSLSLSLSAQRKFKTLSMRRRMRPLSHRQFRLRAIIISSIFYVASCINVYFSYSYSAREQHNNKMVAWLIFKTVGNAYCWSTEIYFEIYLLYTVKLSMVIM